MKDDIHPKYGPVVYIDSSTGKKFIIGSTAKSKETEKLNGQEVPVIRVPTSSASHPFFTKSTSYVDPEGRVDKFLKKYKQLSTPKKESPSEGEEKSSEDKDKPTDK